MDINEFHLECGLGRLRDMAVENGGFEGVTTPTGAEAQAILSHIASLEKDRARLDWLWAHMGGLTSPEDDCWVVNWYFPMMEWPDDIRTAIDAAMAAEGEGAD